MRRESACGTERNITAALRKRRAKAVSSSCLRGKAKLKVHPHREVRGLSKGRWAHFAGSVPMENSRSLIAPETTPRNCLFSEAAGLPWMGGRMKSVSPRTAVLTAPGKDNAHSPRSC